jgi:hypothetical protein
MHRTIHLWLQPTPAQTIALQQTIETVNTARNEISAVAYFTVTFSTRALYDLCAEDVSTRLGLSLAMTHRSIASVAAAYRGQRSVQQRFHPLTSIPYDRHTLRIDAQVVTIWTLIGWQRVAFVTDALCLEDWSLPTLMQLRGAWALLLVVPGLG